MIITKILSSPLKMLLKGARMKLGLLAMVMMTAGAMLLGVTSADPTPSSENMLITGSIAEKIKITLPDALTLSIDPDNDGVGTNPTNTQTVTAIVKQNKPLQGWQVTVADSNTGTNKGHLVKGSTPLTNPLHVRFASGPNPDIDLAGITTLLYHGNGKTTGTNIDVTFSQAGSYSDDPDTGYTITLAFTASYSVPSPPPASPFL